MPRPDLSVAVQLLCLSLLPACVAPPETPAGVDDDDDDGLGPFFDPNDWGPYAAGVRTEVIEDPARGIELTVEIWYPAVDGTGEPDVLAFASASREATALLDHAPYPVIGFSHGSEGVRQQSLFHTEWLASHGYVVIAPDHPFNNQYDGDGPPGYTQAHVAWNRPQDLSAALDWLLARNDEPHMLRGMLDPSRVGVSGHSFGGWTAVILAGARADQAPFEEVPDDIPPGPWRLRDERVLAAVAMAPGGAEAFTDGLSAIETPVLYFGGLQDEQTPFETQALWMFERSPSPTGLVALDGAGHLSFSNLCELVPGFGEGCGDEWLSEDRVFPVTNLYAGAFLGLHVKGDERYAAYLVEGEEPDPAASLILR